MFPVPAIVGLVNRFSRYVENRSYYLLLFYGLFLFSYSLKAGGKGNDDLFENITFQEALDRASLQNKPVFVFFYSPRCNKCNWMLKRQLPQLNIYDFYNENFICIKLNLRKTEVQSLALEYKIFSHHALLFFNSRGGVLLQSSGPLDNHEFIQIGKDVQKRFNWYLSLKTDLENPNYSLPEIIDFLSVEKNDTLARVVLEQRLSEAQQNEFVSQSALSGISLFYNDIHTPSFYRLLRQNSLFIPTYKTDYDNCIYKVCDRFVSENYNAALVDKVLLDSIPYGLGKYALLDYQMVLYKDSIMSFELKKNPYKFKKEYKDSLLVAYASHLDVWIETRKPEAVLLKDEVEFLCENSFFGNDLLKDKTSLMVVKLYRFPAEMYWAYYSDAIYHLIIGENIEAKKLFEKAIVNLRKTDPTNLRLVRYFQMQESTIKL